MLVALGLALAGAGFGWQGLDQWRASMSDASMAETAGDYARAAALYRDAVRIAEAFEPGDPRRTVSLNALAMIHDMLGQFTDAEVMYRRALAAIKESSPVSDLNRAMVLTNLSTLYVETGRMARAKKLLGEALEIQASAAEPDELRKAIVQSSLAELLTITGRHEDAAGVLTNCLEVLERRPDAWAEVAIARNNLGVVRTHQRRFAEAIRLLEESLASLQRGRGPEHPSLVRVMNNLAGARLGAGQSVAAGQQWRRALELAANQLGREHPLYGEILSNYARYLRENGDKAQAKALASRANGILRNSRRRNAMGMTVEVSALQHKSAVLKHQHDLTSGGREFLLAVIKRVYSSRRLVILSRLV
jgi:tetratricopeptide (TPR) repeat protein